MRYAVLLRGVNVGGNRKVAMGDLRRVLESLGHTDVATYLQSGNAVVDAAESDAGKLERGIEKALAKELAVETRVLVRTHDELAAVIEANPFPDKVMVPKFLHVAFLDTSPTAAAKKEIDPDTYLPDRFEFGDRAIYLWYENGSGRSKLAQARWHKLGVVATARNWNTVLELARRTEAS